MNSPAAKGASASLIETLEQVSSQTGKPLEELYEFPPSPVLLNYLWEMFVDLSQSRQNNGFGSSRFTNSEIKAYCELNKLELEIWELSLIKKLDFEYIEFERSQND